jgi:hypothetical protein
MSRSTVPNVTTPSPADPLAPWTVKEAGYPLAGPPWEQLSFCLSPQFRETLGLAGFPQFLLRLGYGPEPKPTPRRAVREVLL